MSTNSVLVGAGRQAGGTTAAVQLASAFNATLVVPTARHAKNAEETARRLHMTPKVMSVEQFVRSGEKSIAPVVVDDADEVLEGFLNARVAALTVNSSPISGGFRG